MKKNTEFGFISEKSDEKKIIQSLLTFLAPQDRVFTKSSSKGVIGSLGGSHKYAYFNLNKDMSTMMHLFPNEDSLGKYKYKKRKDIAWIMRIRIVNDSYSSVDGYDESKTNLYIERMLNVVPLARELMAEWEDKS